ncbi:MAG: hypothetical protein ACM3II_17885, partial [Rhodospirillaceae bacterium]
VRSLWLRLVLSAGGVAAGLAALMVFGVDKLGSAFERIVVWIAMADAVVPLGRGLGWVSLALPRQQFAHSDALQALVEVGLPAAPLALIPLAAAYRGKGSRAERAAFLAVCIEVVVSFPLRLPASGFVAALLAGYLAGGRMLVRRGLPRRRISDGHRVLRATDAASAVRAPSGWRGRAVSI